jgi:hypothetical protein
MTNRVYYIGNTYNNVITANMDEWDSQTLREHLWCMDLNEELECDDNNDINMADRINTEGKKEYVFNIREDWKHTLIDRLATEIKADKADKIIGEIGIRKVMTIVKETGFYDDGMPDMATDEGIKGVFYIVLDNIIDINQKYYKEMTKDEYVMWLLPEDDEEEGSDDEEEECDEVDEEWMKKKEGDNALFDALNVEEDGEVDEKD